MKTNNHFFAFSRIYRTALSVFFSISPFFSPLWGMEHPNGQQNPRKRPTAHQGQQQAGVFSSFQITLPQAKKTRPEEKPASLRQAVQPSHQEQTPYTVVRFAPEDPSTHTKAEQFGLRLFCGSEQIGTIEYELFSKKNHSKKAATHTHKQGEIDALLIEEAYRKKHLGRYLLDLACQELQELGCTKITLNAAPEDKSMLPKLVTFYENAGFQVEKGFNVAEMIDPEDPNPAVPMYKLVTH